MPSISLLTFDGEIPLELDDMDLGDLDHLDGTLPDGVFARLGLNRETEPSARPLPVEPPALSIADLQPDEFLTPEQVVELLSRESAEESRSPYTPSVTTTVAGVGLGATTAIYGKTAFRVGKTDFFITGNPFGLPGVPQKGSTSVLFIVKKDQPRKMYRLDFDEIKSGPEAGAKNWEHNQRGVADILDLQVVDHQPAGLLGRTAGRAITVFKWGGIALFVAGAASSAIDIYYSQSKAREVAAQIGGWAGGWAGAEAGADSGAWAGADAGAWFDGVGAAPGAVIGGVLGAIGGGIAGFWSGHKIVTTLWDWVFTPLEKEEYEIVDSLGASGSQPQ